MSPSSFCLFPLMINTFFLEVREKRKRTLPFSLELINSFAIRIPFKICLYVTNIGCCTKITRGNETLNLSAKTLARILCAQLIRLIGLKSLISFTSSFLGIKDMKVFFNLKSRKSCQVGRVRLRLILIGNGDVLYKW